MRQSCAATRVGFGRRPFCAICMSMHTLLRTGLLVTLIAGLAVLADTALAKRAQQIRERQTAAWYYPGYNVRCVERSFSVSVGNPAYKNRLAYWPAPCVR